MRIVEAFRDARLALRVELVGLEAARVPARVDGLGPRLEQELSAVGGGKVRVVKDPVFVGSDGGLAIALDAPESDWERLSS